MCDYYTVEQALSSDNSQKFVVKVDCHGDIEVTDLDPSFKYFSRRIGYEKEPLLSTKGDELYMDGSLVSSGNPVKDAVYPYVLSESGDLYCISHGRELIANRVAHFELLLNGLLIIRHAQPSGYTVLLIDMRSSLPLEKFHIESLLCTGHRAFAGRNANGLITVWGLCLNVCCTNEVRSIKNGMMSASFDNAALVDVGVVGHDEGLKILVKSIEEGVYFHDASQTEWEFDPAFVPCEFRDKHGILMFVWIVDNSKYLCKINGAEDVVVVGKLAE